MTNSLPHAITFEQLLIGSCALFFIMLVYALVIAARKNRQLRELEQLNAQLQTSLDERDVFFQQQLDEAHHNKQQSQELFEQLAQQVLNNNSQQLAKSQEQAMRLILEPFKSQIATFSQQVHQLHTHQTSSQASLHTELKNLQQLNLKITKEAQALSQALKGNKKLAGNWGEIQLERCLQAAGLEKDTHYQRESSYRDNEQQLKRPDFIINLPNNKHIIVDSKISLIDFTLAIEADDAKDRQGALVRHCKALRRHIDGLASKAYSELKDLKSPPFVLMFIAIEPALTEALKLDNTLYDYGLSKNIMLTSPTTLMPILKTISQLWLMERSHSEAIELADRADDIYQQLHVLAERLQKLGRSLNTSNQHYNDVVTALAGRQGLYNKTERFSSLAKNTRELPEINTNLTECSVSKLENELEEGY